jgi:hypothetical protein
MRLLKITAFLALAATAGCLKNGAPKASGEKVVGAYDVIKMCRYAEQMGPIYFAHRLHANLVSREGRLIRCDRCHRPACDDEGGERRACYKCHSGLDRPTDKLIRSI